MCKFAIPFGEVCNCVTAGKKGVFFKIKKQPY